MINETNSYKNSLSPIKCQVTRIDDPEMKNRIQVYIPSYHGEYDKNNIGIGESMGVYPWAQMCTILFKDTTSYASDALKDCYAGDIPVILPSVGTIGWVLFEGGDTRAPIYMGSLAKGEINEMVAGSLNGSDSNNLLVNASGNAQLDIMKNIIFDQESGRQYDAINPSDGPDNNGVTCISIGLLQWFYTRAQNLLQKIYAVNPSQFAYLCATNGSTLNLRLNASFKDYTISTSSNDYKALKAILATQESISVQNELVYSDLSEYQKHAIEQGVTSFDAQIYYCDLENQGGAGGASKIAKLTSDKSLEGLHRACLNSGTKLGTTYKNRRIEVYNAIKQLGTTGANLPSSSTNLPATSQMQFTLQFPCECKNVVRTFNRMNYPQICISTDDPQEILGMDVVAAHSGTAEFHKSAGNFGWYVDITSGKYMTRYTNLWDYVGGHGSTMEVTAGQKIGRAGMSGSVTQPCVMFQFRINGVPTDPMPYLTGVSNNLNATGNGVIETAINWMVSIANDSSHGYDQTYRWGEKGDYDCSALVITGFQNAGIDVKGAGATYTENMRKAFVACGFQAIPYVRGMNLIRGDVLLNEKHHTACYIGNNQIVQASINENGMISGGKPGDQTGREIAVRDMYEYSKGWDCILRYGG